MQDSSPAPWSMSPWSISLAAATLACLVLAVFLPILDFEFIDYDVKGQLLENPHVQGLDVASVKAIFTSRCITSYYPVRTLTYMADCQIWGLHAGGFKLSNVFDQSPRRIMSPSQASRS